MPAAGHPGDVENDVEPTEHLREAGPSGTPSNSEQNPAPPLYHQLSHDCEGPRCLCQRYENGELAAVVLNQNQNQNQNQNRDRDRDRDREGDNYQNLPRGHRIHAARQNQNLPGHPNLNPNYQNPADFIPNDNHPSSSSSSSSRRGANGDRDRRNYEPEENIYERLDEVGRDYGHTYERIDDRAWYRRARYRAGPQNVAGPSGANADLDANRNLGGHHSDQVPRDVYVESRRITSPSCLSRLGRNCFSTENIASASNRRYVYQLGHNCTCQFCRHLDARAFCQYCHNFHDRFRHQEANNITGLNGSRHYIYQLSRSCRCAFCRDDSPYARYPVNSRISESFRRECHCRNPGSCSCRHRFLSYSNPAIYIGRIDRAVNNPLYASPAATHASPSTSNATPGLGEPSTSSGRGTGTSTVNSSTLAASVCPANRSTDRQHVCDDSCIRNQNVGNVYQVLGRCERAECQHGRISIHWVFVNKWLPSWGAQDSVPEADSNPEVAPREEEPRDQPGSDTEES